MIRTSLVSVMIPLALLACSNDKQSSKPATQAEAATPVAPDKLENSPTPATAGVSATSTDNMADNMTDTSAKTPLPMLDFRNAREAHGFLVGGALTADHVVQAKENGYTRIIDVRSPDEEGVAEQADKAKELGLEYHNLPTDLSDEGATKFAELLRAKAGPTIINCRSGNRVGAMFAVAAFVADNKPAAEALEIGLAAGLKGLEPKVRERLGLPAKPEE